MPKKDLQRRIDLRPGGGRGLSGTGIAPSATGFDDTHLVRRDGTHSLYSLARWLWESGAEVNATFRSWGSGLLEVFGYLYAGRREGPRAGLGEYVADNGYRSAVLEAVGSDNV